MQNGTPTCVDNTQEVSCDISGTLTANASWPQQQVLINWTAASGWEAAPTCSWTCNVGFHAEQYTCVENTRPCDIINGIGEESWNTLNNTWGASCAVKSCNEGYEPAQGDICVPSLATVFLGEAQQL